MYCCGLSLHKQVYSTKHYISNVWLINVNAKMHSIEKSVTYNVYHSFENSNFFTDNLTYKLCVTWDAKTVYLLTSNIFVTAAMKKVNQNWNVNARGGCMWKDHTLQGLLSGGTFWTEYPNLSQFCDVPMLFGHVENRQKPSEIVQRYHSVQSVQP